MRKSRKVISLVLSVIMFMTCFAVALPHISFEAKAATIADTGITCEHVVDNYQTYYDSYELAYLNGYGEATNLVIPGLSDANDYVVQGMAYYEEKGWAMITAYHGNKDNPGPSYVFAIDVATGDFVAMFSFLNVPDANGNRTVNTDHGGGIAISDNNFYYACGDLDQKVAYAPLSEFDLAEGETYKVIELRDEVVLYELGSAYTAYVCFDEGVLWAGNFYGEGLNIFGSSVMMDDYRVKAHANYNQLVLGYKLKGNNSDEEWANFKGATGEDCQGNPSYVIALEDSTENVQYAIVDNGKLYLSRSWGIGEPEGTIADWVGDALLSLPAWSTLSVYDIDITVPGTTAITLPVDSAGNTIDTKAYAVSNGRHFDFMPMSEGLCVIDDYLYVVFESATKKYRTDGVTVLGTCQYPIDVAWKIDMYGLMGEERPNDEEVTAYQRVNSLSEISDTDEYMIVYESERKTEGTQKNILYALDPFGGYNGDKLPKTNNGTNDSTLDSMGMVGHEITNYHIYTTAEGKEYLYLEEPEKDDATNLRWNIMGTDTGSLRLHNVDLYCSSNAYLYFDSRLMYMSTNDNANLDNIKLAESSDTGYFNLYNKTGSSSYGYYLWCNDGSQESYMNVYDNYYANGNESTDKYTGLKEIPGTFHGDGKKFASGENSGNQLATQAGNAYMNFKIYKRMTINPNELGGTGLETNLKAELQSDGTYTINMGTYATGSSHKYLGESGYPTDFVFILDASGSMTNNSDYITYSSVGAIDISYGNIENKEYYIYYNGEYCRLNGHSLLGNWNISISAQTSSGKVYLKNDGTTTTDQGSTEQDGNSTVFWPATTVYARNTATRLQGMKNTVNNFITEIANNANVYNTEHRISIIQFGSDANESYLNTGMYSTLNGTTMNQYGTDVTQDDYNYSFYPASHSNLKTIVNSIDTTQKDPDPDTYANYGMEMATFALAAQSPQFGGVGDKYYNDWTDDDGVLHEKNANAVVIFLTDGVPGVGDVSEGEAAAQEVANKTIDSANVIKSAGGTVYGVQISNPSLSKMTFDMPAYMDRITSNYSGATTMSNGTVVASDYYVKAATDGYVDVQQVVDGTFKHIKDTIIDVGTAITLDTDAIVRQTLGSNFKLTNESKVRTALSNVTYDVLGNIAFEPLTTPSGATATADVASNTVQVTGFNYSGNYFGNGNDGKRLDVIIEGVLPVDNEDTVSIDISNDVYTAIYEDATNMANGKKFKGYPNATFSIPQYTYVLDYGIQMLDTDVNGTLCSVSNDLSKQTTYTTSAVNGMLNIDTATAGNGKVNQNLIYKINPTQKSDKGYALIQRDDGTYDWFRINVVPASNVLYEEETMVDGTTGKAWSTEYSTTENKPINTSQSITGAGDTYGYDAIYATTTNDHSNGTAYKATVDATNKRSAGKTVTFNGTGFDLISACGANTGILTVTVKDSAGKIVKGYIVDTYYRDTDNMNTKGLACQVPVVNFTGDYGTYTVETTALYLSNASALNKSVTGTTSKGKLEATTGVPVTEADAKVLLAELGMTDLANADLELVWFDDNSILNGGSGAAGNINTRGARADGRAAKSLDCYIDGFRVYNPLDNDSSKYIATEQMPQYINVLKSLKDRNDSVSSGATVGDIAYVETALTDGTLDFANYNQVGPQNEVYLKGGSTGNALVLKVQLSNTSEVHLGLRAVNGTATVKIGGTDFVINGPTEMYYDVTDCLEVDQNTGMATITIQNAGTGLLAVNNIKMTQQGTIATLEESDLSEASMLMMKAPVRANVVDGVVTPVVEDTDTDVGTDNDVDTGSSNLSFIEQIIAKIIELLSSIFKFIPVGEVM